MLDPFDKSRCSFPIPDFASEDEEEEWARSLTPQQRLELLYLMQLARYGEEAMNRPMDRTHIESLTMEEFNQLKEKELAEEEAWRAANGWPPRLRKPRQQD